MNANTNDETADQDSARDTDDDSKKASPGEIPQAPDESDVSHGDEVDLKDGVIGEGTAIGKSGTIGGEGFAPPEDGGQTPGQVILGEGAPEGNGLLPTPGDEILGEGTIGGPAPADDVEAGEVPIDENEIVRDDIDDDDDIDGEDLEKIDAQF